MANTTPIIHKRTFVSGRLPEAANTANTRYIYPGELSINLTDKKVHVSNGSVLFEIGANLSTLSVQSILANGSIGTNGQSLLSNGTAVYWSDDKGYTGSAGFTGSQGVTGFVGSQGDIGFTGSRGIDGVIGYDGSIGFTGSQGVIGFTGSRGTDGVIGYNGSTGFTGSQGVIGFTGSRGTDGVIGYNGSTGFTGSQGDIGFVGSKGDIGFTGSSGPVTSYVFDGGSPTSNYSLGPAFDCGGVL